MRHCLLVPAIASLLLAAAACNVGRHSSAGFRLPDNGDPERGKATFLALGCNRCHRVAGVDLPAPVVLPAVPVVLGGEVSVEKTDGYLVTSIINPSYELAAYPRDRITLGGESRMPAHVDNITVRQLTDVVAFLQSQYTVRRPLPPK